MVTLPPGFIATRYPGYFWHAIEQRLYSLKVDGILKPIKAQKPNRFNLATEPYYRVSVRGRRRAMGLRYLKSLKYEASVIPVKRDD